MVEVVPEGLYGSERVLDKVGKGHVRGRGVVYIPFPSIQDKNEKKGIIGRKETCTNI